MSTGKTRQNFKRKRGPPSRELMHSERCSTSSTPDESTSSGGPMVFMSVWKKLGNPFHSKNIPTTGLTVPKSPVRNLQKKYLAFQKIWKDRNCTMRNKREVPSNKTVNNNNKVLRAGSGGLGKATIDFLRTHDGWGGPGNIKPLMGDKPQELMKIVVAADSSSNQLRNSREHQEALMRRDVLYSPMLDENYPYSNISAFHDIVETLAFGGDVTIHAHHTHQCSFQVLSAFCIQQIVQRTFESMASTIFLTPSDQYSNLEKQKLEEFRQALSDLCLDGRQQHDSYLIRWLRARNLDLKKAEEMLRNSLKWRKENNIDGMDERETVPEDIAKITPVAFCGISTEGYAIFLSPFGRHDPRYALEKYGIDFCKRINVLNMEKIMKLVDEEGMKVGKRVTQIIQILDCEGYSYRQMSSRLCREFMIQMQKQMDDHYPELLRYGMIVNAPKVFVLLYNMLKPFVPKHTLEKIEIYGPDAEKWKAVVREHFPHERIPPHWGGTMEGVDEYCSGSDIWVQGPGKALKAFMRGLSEADSDFEKTIVCARSKFVKEVQVFEEDTILEWKFKTEQHDIGFQVSYGIESQNNNKNEQQTIIVPYSRLDANTSVQEGSVVCKASGKYCFIFDNNFSMLKSKTLLYQILVINPEQEVFEDCPQELLESDLLV